MHWWSNGNALLFTPYTHFLFTPYTLPIFNSSFDSPQLLKDFFFPKCSAYFPQVEGSEFNSCYLQVVLGKPFPWSPTELAATAEPQSSARWNNVRLPILFQPRYIYFNFYAAQGENSPGRSSFSKRTNSWIICLLSCLGLSMVLAPGPSSRVEFWWAVAQTKLSSVDLLLLGTNWAWEEHDVGIWELQPTLVLISI